MDCCPVFTFSIYLYVKGLPQALATRGVRQVAKVYKSRWRDVKTQHSAANVGMCFFLLENDPGPFGWRTHIECCYINVVLWVLPFGCGPTSLKPCHSRQFWSQIAKPCISTDGTWESSLQNLGISVSKVYQVSPDPWAVAVSTRRLADKYCNLERCNFAVGQENSVSASCWEVFAYPGVGVWLVCVNALFLLFATWHCTNLCFSFQIWRILSKMTLTLQDFTRYGHPGKIGKFPVLLMMIQILRSPLRTSCEWSLG